MSVSNSVVSGLEESSDDVEGIVEGYLKDNGSALVSAEELKDRIYSGLGVFMGYTGKSLDELLEESAGNEDTRVGRLMAPAGRKYYMLSDEQDAQFDF